MNYKNMTEEEITYQLEWSDENEFGTNYAKFLREENKQLIEVLRINHQIIDMYVEKMDKANEILNKSCFEYDNCPDSVINEIIELKEILGDKENE